ncbi:MAG TPA: GDSL-type esterase/lipase family protein [Arachidicoccus sp.]|nr:GDSL-type esterase/lipase family protein [Arachidicoccus sp.]
MHRPKSGKRLLGAGWIIGGSIRQGRLFINCICLLIMGSVGVHSFTRLPVYTLNTESVDSCIKVACIGASTTFGEHIENQPLNGFPEQLQRLLGGAHWTVRNFGVNGGGVLTKGEIPYRETTAWRAAIAFHPDIVLLNLGVNDVKPGSWVYQKDFMHDYAAL